MQDSLETPRMAVRGSLLQTLAIRLPETTNGQEWTLKLNINGQWRANPRGISTLGDRDPETLHYQSNP